MKCTQSRDESMRRERATSRVLRAPSPLSSLSPRRSSVAHLSSTKWPPFPPAPRIALSLSSRLFLTAAPALRRFNSTLHIQHCRRDVVHAPASAEWMGCGSGRQTQRQQQQQSRVLAVDSRTAPRAIPTSPASATTIRKRIDSRSGRVRHDQQRGDLGNREAALTAIREVSAASHRFSFSTVLRVCCSLVSLLCAAVCCSQAILSEEDRVVVIRFGHDYDKTCMGQDEVLFSLAEDVKNFAVVYLVDITEVPDFNTVRMTAAQRTAK